MSDLGNPECLPPLDIGIIRQCLLTLVVQANNPAVIKEADKYLAETERHPLFYKCLIELFEKDEDYNIKLQSMLCLKNYMSRNWINRRSNQRLSISFTDRTKTEVKEYLISYLQTTGGTGKFIKHIHEFFRMIIKNDFPSNFIQLSDYLVLMVQQVAAIATKGEAAIFFSEGCRNFFKLLKIMFEEQSKKRIASSKKVFYELTMKLVEGLKISWGYVNKVLNSCLETSKVDEIVIVFKFSQMLDQIILYILTSTFSEVHHDEQMIDLIGLLLNKVAGLLQLFQKISISQVQNAVLKNIKIIVYELTNVQYVFPLTFRNHFENYMELLDFILGNINLFRDKEEIIKAAQLGLYKVLKTFAYYSDSDMFNSSINNTSNLKNFSHFQKDCHAKFKAHFSYEKIKMYLDLFILSILPLTIMNSEKEDSNAEIEEDIFLDDTNGELHNSNYTIALCTIERMFVKFFEEVVPLFGNLLNNLLMSNFKDMSSSTQEGIFAIIGLIPKVLTDKRKDKEGYNSVLNLLGAIEYLKNNIGAQKSLAKRIPIITARWVDLLEDEILQNLSGIIIYLLINSDDINVKYNCCLCLKRMTTKQTLVLNYGEIIEEISPIIMLLLEKSFSPNYLWNLLSLLIKLIEKSHYVCGENTLKILEIPAFRRLLGLKEELIRGALIDMFKNLIVSFPVNMPISPIFNLCLNFIDILMSSAIVEGSADNTTISFWYFVIKEYSPIQNLDSVCKELLFKYNNCLLEDDDPQNIPTILYLLEEYFLLGFLPFEETKNLLVLAENKYLLSSEAGNIEFAIEIRLAALNLVASLLLVSLNNKSFENIPLFQGILGLIVKDIFDTNINKMARGIIGMKNSLVTMFNRFFIQNPNDVLMFISSLQIYLPDFYKRWFTNMEFLSSKLSCKINTISLLQAIEYLDKDTLLSNLGFIIKQVIPDVYTFIENSQRGGSEFDKPVLVMERHLISQTRLNEKKPSERKESLRKTQVFDDVDLKGLMIVKFKSMLDKYGLNEIILKDLVQDNQLIEKLKDLL